METQIEELLKLPIEQKIEIIDRLWDSIKDTKEEESIPEWHYQILEERLEKYKTDPNSGRSWQEVRERITKK